MPSFFQDTNEISLYQDIQKTFNSSPLITRNCIKVINNLMYFLTTKELDSDTLNSILIYLLKAFQSKEQYLKNVIYTTVIELSKYTDQGFIGINIFVKDYMTSKIKNKIIRSLFCIVPDEMVYDFTKYLNECFISKSDELINSGVLVGYTLISKNFTKIKDLYTPLQITDDIHGYQRLAWTNSVNQDIGNCIYKNEAGVISVRIAVKKRNYDLFKTFLNLRISDKFVFFEACKQVAEMNEEISVQFISTICQGLKKFLKSDNFYEKFSAIKTLSRLSLKYPKNIEILNKEIEDLLQENSKSLTMFTISTLLKTGNEETIDRLMKYLPEFMTEMDDTYKILGLNALLTLTLKNKSRIDAFIEFIKGCILAKGTLNFKMHIIKILNKFITENKVEEIIFERILNIFIIYLEDSEYFEISSEILGILGQQIYKSKNYKKYVMHIYNRLILEDHKIKIPAVQCIFDLSKKIDVDKEFNFDCGDEILKNFYMNLSLQKFNTPKYQVTDKMLEYLSKYNLQEEKKEEIQEFKICREIQLNDDTSEIFIFLKKVIKLDKIILEFKIENRFEDVQVKNGNLNIKIKDNVNVLNFKNLLPLKNVLLQLEINKEEGINVNGVLDYEICLLDDFNDSENETLTLKPFQITVFDLMDNKYANKGNFNRLIQFYLNCNLVEGTKKILDLINLKILEQSNKKNSNIIVLCGTYFKKNCFIECNIEYTNGCQCYLNIWCDDQDLLEKLCNYFN